MVLSSPDYPVQDLGTLLAKLEYAKAILDHNDATTPEISQIQKQILEIYGNVTAVAQPCKSAWTQDTKAKHEVRGQKNREFISRVAMALFGGAALVVPLLITTLHPTTLLTTSVIVFVVAVALEWLMEDAQPKDIVAATAASAAVLVVLVGTISGGR